MAAKKKKDAATGSSAADEAGATTFEEDMERLEEIVEQLESGDLPLERAIELFDEGTRLGRRCGARLDDVERKITVLIERADGSLDEEALDEADVADAEEGEGGATKKAAVPKARRASASRASPKPSSASGGGLFDDGGDEDEGIPF